MAVSACCDTVLLGISTQVEFRVVDSEAIHRAKSNRSLRAASFAANPRSASLRANFALLRLVQVMREVALTQSSCWRRILDAGSFATVCAG